MLCTWMIDMVFSLVCAQMMLLAGAATFTPVPWVRIRYRHCCGVGRELPVHTASCALLSGQRSVPSSWTSDELALLIGGML